MVRSDCSCVIPDSVGEGSLPDSSPVSNEVDWKNLPSAKTHVISAC